MGSVSLQCNYTSGTCRCKNGVNGTKCDQCMTGYTKMGLFGCQKCSCDPSGSVNQICNATTGQCQCKVSETNLRIKSLVAHFCTN